MGGDAGQHVTEVAEGVDAVALAGGDEAEEDGGGPAAAVGAAEHQVLSSEADAPEGVNG